MTNLNDLTTLALSRAVSTKEDKAARDGVTAGTYEVDVTVRVRGTIEVLDDTEKTPTVSLPMKEVLALFIARSGCTREASIALLRECMTDALREGVKGEGAVAAAADIDAQYKAAVKDMLATLPKTPVRGAVKADIETHLVCGSSVNRPSADEAAAA
jgi:hypothetical protein